jgi:hypothetical protein
MHADKLPITGPCPIDLDAIGFDRAAKVAHCSHCAKSVTVLSNMTRGEAREFLSEHKGQKMCVSYARDEDGRIRFQPDPEPALVPVTRLRPRAPAAPVVLPATGLARRSSRAAGFVAALGVTAALAACAPHGEPPREIVEGKMTVPHVIDEPTPPKPIVAPMAGAAEIPREVVEGKMTVPDPDTVGLDEPCDKAEPTMKSIIERPIAKPDPIPVAGGLMIPDDMVDGEMAVPDPETVDLDAPVAKPTPR